MTELERIENELKLAGYRLEPVKDGDWSDDDYVQNIGNCAWEICKLFCEQGHSGMSAGYTISLIKKLLDGKPLMPLTANPDEWYNYDKNQTTKYQSKRCSSCFSDDNLKTYYDINAEENREFELDENGKRTGWSSLKPFEELVKHELPPYEV